MTAAKTPMSFYRYDTGNLYEYRPHTVAWLQVVLILNILQGF